MKLIKNNKGSTVTEAILLMPIFLYMFFFTIVQLLSFSYNGTAYENSRKYMNEFETSRTFESAINKLSKAQHKSHLEIIKIKIVDKEDKSISYFLEFPEDTEVNNNSFKDFTNKETGEFMLDSFKESNADKIIGMQNLWKKGNYITIETKQNVLGSIGKLANFTLKVPGEDPLSIHIFPNDTIEIETTGIVESELEGGVV